MKISKLSGINIESSAVKKAISKTNSLIKHENYSTYTPENIKANFMPAFKGNAPQIKKACIITQDYEDIPLLATCENGSYIVDFDSQTELIYGKDAIKFLNKTQEFKYDTQIIFPKKSKGYLETDGKTIELKENSAAVLNQNSKAKIKVEEGYPMIILSKKDYDWYERYSKDAKSESIRNKFIELMQHNAHLYNGEFSPSILLSDKLQDANFLNEIGINKWQAKTWLIDEIYAKKHLLDSKDLQEIENTKKLVDKLLESHIATRTQDGYIKPYKLYAKNYFENLLKSEGFNKEETEKLIPILDMIRTTKIDSKFLIKSEAKDFSEAIISKLKSLGILFDNKKDLDSIYWRHNFTSAEEFRKFLWENDFSYEEQSEIISAWQKSIKTGLDASGLKFINENMAVYNLDDKLNNWTLEKTNWVTNSTAPTTTQGKTPFIGVSLVQTDKQGHQPISALRKGEKLHSHPNLAEKRQTEVYLVTSGKAALNIVKDGKTQIKILNEGELAVIGAGVEHCINSVYGEYEHIVAQVPSAFQYGFGFKQDVIPPNDYDEEILLQKAYAALNE